MLSKAGAVHTVCVATSYGSDVMPDDPFVTVRVGRMDRKQMEEFLAGENIGDGDIIIDATHPYASGVSANIRDASAKTGCRLITVARGGDAGSLSSGEICHASIEEAAASLDKCSGNIMLTTGSGTLSKYCENVSAETLARTYVRILPAKESLDICEELGIEKDHVIAMQGPFTYGLNRELMLQYDIRHMVTKDSGAAGGFAEKISAAQSLGISCHIIMRPECRDAADGVSIYEAFETVTGRACHVRRRIILAGIGMGTKGIMTKDTFEAIRHADAVFGAKSVTAGVTAKRKYDMYLAKDIIKVLEDSKDIENAVVLFSGDPGFYSGAKDAYDKLSKWEEDTDITVLPGVSSVSYLASKLATSWDDAAIVSIHGKAKDASDELIRSIRYTGKTFALLSGAKDMSSVAKALQSEGISPKIFVGRNMSQQDESIEKLSLFEAESYERDGKITVLFINEHPDKKRIINTFDDDDFLREDIPMTKECVRHESIRRLAVCEHDLVFDIGGGTGSVALEAAALSPTVRVITIEKDKKAASLIKKNVEKLGLKNVTVIEGDAVSSVEDLDRPDCVFIGGSGGRMGDIINSIKKKGRGIRYVVNAVSLETIEETNRLIDEFKAYDVKIVQMAVSNIRTVGSHHMMQAQNPVTVFSFTI